MSDERAVKHRPLWMIGPILLALALGIPNLIVIVLGVEDFPFTTAPMFAHYVDSDSELYSFRFEGVMDGRSEPLPLDLANTGQVEAQRRLLSWYYRPITDTSPFRSLSGPATPDEFAADMADFFAPITDFLRDRRGMDYDGVDLYVDVSDSTGQVLESALVGHFDTASREYTHLYEVPSP